MALGTAYGGVLGWLDPDVERILTDNTSEVIVDNAGNVVIVKDRP